jgi:hypothetical protein
MWNSIEKYGYTKEEIDTIAEGLLANEIPRERCPDCSVIIDEEHFDGCDVSRCTVCGGQELQCECDQETRDKWDGLWPGTKSALEQRLICCWDDSKVWQADLNELARRR